MPRALIRRTQRATSSTPSRNQRTVTPISPLLTTPQLRDLVLAARAHVDALVYLVHGHVLDPTPVGVRVAALDSQVIDRAALSNVK